MNPYFEAAGVTLYHGDCREVLPALSGVDCVVTDPPYGIGLSKHDSDGYRRAGSYEIAGDDSQDAGIDVLGWCEREGLPTVAFADAMQPWPGKWRQYLVWDKGGAVGGGGDVALLWKQSWELIQIARTPVLNGGRDEAVLRFLMRPQASVNHPAAKPLNLLRYLIQKTTMVAQVVADPFTGSGTTGVACVQTGRRFIGVEIEERYCEIAAKRIQAALAQGRLFGPEQVKPVQLEMVAA